MGSRSQPDALAEKNRPPVRLASGQVIDDWVTLEEKRLVAVADAMPADKYPFDPTNAIALTENCRPVLSIIAIFQQLSFSALCFSASVDLVVLLAIFHAACLAEVRIIPIYERR